MVVGPAAACLGEDEAFAEDGSQIVERETPAVNHQGVVNRFIDLIARGARAFRGDEFHEPVADALCI